MFATTHAVRTLRLGRAPAAAAIAAMASSMTTASSVSAAMPSWSSASAAHAHRLHHACRWIHTPRGGATNGLPHDVGGLPSAYGALKLTNPDDLLDWEVRCHSLMAVLAQKGAVSTDGIRRSIEALTPAQYEDWGYYEKWAAAMTSLLLERGLVSTEEMNEALFGTELTSSSTRDGKPMFSSGDCVRVRSYRCGEGGDDSGPGMEWRRPHIRVPGYIYGVRGVIERVCDEHEDPSFKAFGLDAPKSRLYRVRFRMRDVWPEHRDDGTSDNDNDAIEVEVYEPWLESSSESSGHDFEGNELFDHTHDGSDCIQHGGEDPSGHDHNHDHDHGDHSHDPRPMVEDRAVSREGGPRPGKELYQALTKVLTGKGIVTPDEVRSMSENLVMAGQTLNGASLVARAWIDPAFEERLLKDPPSAAAELGINTSNPNAPTVLTVVPNTPSVHNLVVCTLCSCYPSGLLGIAPSWYKSREFRSRAVREPRRVLAEFGTDVTEGCRVRVHDSTADHRYLVLPRRPEGTEGWTEEDLRALVTRDSMVGVSLPRLPKV